jgi:uncharacterized damage-inducible protein DinB
MTGAIKLYKREFMKTSPFRNCFLIFLVLTIAGPKLIAQTSPDSIKAQLVKDWERARLYTREYLEAMPAEKYGFRPVDSIRSFAEQMLHLAQGNIGLVANGTGAARIFPGLNLEKSPGAQSRDSVEYYVMASYDYCIDAIKNLDPAKLNEKFTAFGFTLSRLVWIQKAFEHQTHHRGQATIYIRLQGIRPPAEKLF